MRPFPAPPLLFFILAAALLATGGCQRKPKAGSAATESSTAAEGEQSTAGVSAAGAQPVLARLAPAPAEIWKEFSGAKAMAHVETQINFGPRPSGSKELASARQAIIAALKEAGWVAEEQAFTGDTPHGPIAFVNVIARHPGLEGRTPNPSAQKAIVCSHYDTKRFSTIRFVGASDAASSTGALLELARVLNLDPQLAGQIELVFFDGEEAVQQFTETDGLYGSRHYAEQLAKADRAKQFKFAILWDMIGDKDLTITLPPDSPRDLADGILASADSLGLRQHFGYYRQTILDDHVPLARRGIKAIDLIDFDYMPWHTADDKREKLSEESLQKVGAVTLHYLRKMLLR
jgi:glutaminyl-peptide cyclotransferase